MKDVVMATLPNNELNRLIKIELTVLRNVLNWLTKKSKTEKVVG